MLKIPELDIYIILHQLYAFFSADPGGIQNKIVVRGVCPVFATGVVAVVFRPVLVRAVNELVGPLLTRNALMSAGEIKPTPVEKKDRKRFEQQAKS